MKKIWKYSFVLLAGLSLTVACSKEAAPSADENVIDPSDQTEPGQPQKMVTITVSMPEDGLTRVAFEQDPENPDGAVKLTWEKADKILVNGEEFTLVSGAGTQTAGFSGPEVTGNSYTIAYNGGEFGATQRQAADADTGHLAYTVSLADVNTYQDVEFTQAWATAHGGGTLTQSSIFRLRAQMPAGVAEDVVAVKIVAKDADDAPVNIFYGGNELTVMIDAAGDAGEDGILDIYANLPTTAAAIPAGTAFFVRFMTTARGSVYSYTRYHVFSSALELTPGKVNALKLNCTATDKHAGNKTVCDGTTAAKAYLIGDAYQLMAVNGLMVSQKRYFKLIDNIDMKDMSWTYINPQTDSYRPVDFDGNNKTISNLGGCLFYNIVDGSSVRNLTLDKSSVTQRGALSEFVQTSGNEFSNINITNGSVNSSSNNVGGLIGQINSGVSGLTTATITNCTVSGTDVTGKGVVGGVIGFANELVTISGCKYTGGTVKASARYCGGFVGSTADVASVISDCQVENATIESSHTDDARIGGFVGQLQTKVQVKGCTVGTSSDKVVINTAQPASGKVLNEGGFVGVNYGTITKNGDVRTKAYVQVKSANTVGQQINVGGFAGFQRGTVEYSDAIVDMSEMQGQYIGGFAAYITQAGTTIDNCTVSGSVRGNNYTGMFAGYVDAAVTISNNTASGSVIGQSSAGGFVGYCKGGPTFVDNTTSADFSFRGTNGGGFAGALDEATMTRCSSTGTLTKTSGTGNVMGGFAGYVDDVTLDGCYATGAVNANNLNTEYVGGFIGQVMPSADKVSDIRNCYATGAVTGKGRWVGGFIGYLYSPTPGTATVSKCHATGNVSSTGNYCGGFIGRILMDTDVLIEKCYATGNASSAGTYVSGFIGDIDGTADHSILDCYATGALTQESTRYRGGLLAAIQANPASVTISRCYTANAITGTFEIGGMIGRTNAANFTIEDCAAWNPSVSASSRGEGNWSSAAIIGVTFPLGYARNNYRKPDMTLQVYWVPASNYSQPDVEGATHPLTDSSGAEMTDTKLANGQPHYPQYAYHGKVEAGKTLSQLASTTLGWSGDVWDFTGDLPTLK